MIRVLANVDRVYWRLYAARQEARLRRQEYDLAVAQLGEGVPFGGVGLADVVGHGHGDLRVAVEDGLRDVPEAGMNAAVELITYYEKLIDAKRRTPSGDLTSALIALAALVALGHCRARTPMERLAESSSPFALAASEIFGGTWGKVVALVAMISTFGCLNGWILLQGRVPLAAAEDGLFPKKFAEVDPVVSVEVEGTTEA
mgnify:CR=1 FL=1